MDEWTQDEWIRGLGTKSKIPLFFCPLVLRPFVL